MAKRTELKYYQELATRWQRDDRERDNAYDAYDNMYHNNWRLPTGIAELQWIRAVVSSDPHDAISAGTRVLSTLMPNIWIQPTFDSEGTKQKANEWEKNLKWQLKSANRRRQAGIVRDVVKSALLYDEVVMNVIDLDHQISQKEMFKGDTRREKAARRYGRFMINTYNPKDVHVRYSNLMPEAVLLIQKKDALVVMDEWGDKAKELMKYSEATDRDVTLYDYTDYEYRCVWVEPGKSGGGADAIVILGPDKHEVPFLPWVAMVGGSTLESSEKHKRQPMLYSIYTSGQWETQNVVKSLYTSEVITRAASPRFKQEGASQQEAEIDYGDPTRIAKVPAGSTLSEMRPPEIDRALAEIDDRIAASVDKSTVSRILQNADIPAGTAFATLNLATQTAVGALKPAKDLAEKALAEMFVQMLLWVEYTGKALDAYGADKEDMGKQYRIEPDEIEPTAIYVEVELKPDVPTDRQQRANTAALMVNSIDYPKELALEDVGIEDPQDAMKQRAKERLYESMVENEIAKIRMALEMQFQQMAQQQQMMQQMSAQQEQQQMIRGPGDGRVSGMPGQAGVPGGQAYNPAMAGLPAQMAGPRVTREMVTGETQGGVPIEEEMI